MQEAVFILNDRFVVDSAKNEIFDRQSGTKSKLEPRLMRLLCLLAGEAGQLVRREQIISQVWDNYPGANEGLNQAISFLRKLLADEQKSIIRTQPKSGYILEATVTRPAAVHRRSKNALPFAIATSIVLALVLLIVTRYHVKDQQPPYRIIEQQDSKMGPAEMARLDSIHQAERMKQ